MLALIAMLALSSSTTAAAGTPDDTCAIYAALGHDALQWTADHAPPLPIIEAAMAADGTMTSSVISCDWRKLGLAPAQNAAPDAKASIIFIRPNYRTPDQADAGFLIIHKDVKSDDQHSPRTVASVASCKMSKRDGKWVVGPCEAGMS